MDWRRGDVYQLALRGKGHVLDGPHPAVVVQAQRFDQLSTIVVVPCSHAPAPWRPLVTVDGRATYAQPEQVLAVRPEDLGDYLDHLDPDDVRDVVDAVHEVIPRV